MTQLARLVYIVFTLLRFGVDDIALSACSSPWLRALARIAKIGRRFDEPRGVRLARALETPGPEFSQIRQVQSTPRDLLPPDIVDDSPTCRIAVPPFSGRRDRSGLSSAARLARPLASLFRLRRRTGAQRVDRAGAFRDAAQRRESP
jgi:ubiquinone biosynthesis protein